jgi:hypothetical protein
MLLFLDFDGVLHPFSRPAGPLTLAPHFERVMRDFPQVDIVISSTWREAYPLARLRSFFSDDIAGRIIGVTPVFATTEYLHVREAEIRSWLQNNGRDDEEWVAIDDMASFFTPLCDNLILVDGEAGFSLTTEQELRKRLG